MKTFAVYLQIRELFNGEFTWHGLVLLFLFVLMGFIAVSLPVYVGYKAFRSKPKSKDDV